ncbi:hypothetical protein [Thalassobacillus sp. CUG 92003]|uniref:hypothetical protein n=1 Tax=Thalassobacillus sp. CUG 92003 TaxID=2736641 RepID=UPI0015E76E0C|nr:hypothetical protein [Thalassobacillus sp. CUG 92003]
MHESCDLAGKEDIYQAKRLTQHFLVQRPNIGLILSVLRSNKSVESGRLSVKTAHLSAQLLFYRSAGRISV